MAVSTGELVVQIRINPVALRVAKFYVRTIGQVTPVRLTVWVCNKLIKLGLRTG